MTAELTETRPERAWFDHDAYGVSLTYVGEDGHIAAWGHVPPFRFIAAANHLTRRVMLLCNIADARDASASAHLADVQHCWAVSNPEQAAASFCDWWLDCGTHITESTPGAFPVTYLRGEW